MPSKKFKNNFQKTNIKIFTHSLKILSFDIKDFQMVFIE